MKNLLARIAALGFLLLGTSSAVAATYCVSNSTELNAALTAAKMDPDSVARIDLVEGDYVGDFIYATTVADQATTHLLALALESSGRC